MKKTHEQENKIKRAIRDAIVIDPLISVQKLQDTLFERGFKTTNGKALDWHYVAKLVRKVNREAATNVNRQEISQRLSETKERFRLMTETLMRIAFYTDDMKKEGMPPPTYTERIRSLEGIVKLDLAILQAEMDAGIFERHIGTLEVEKRYQPLPPELKEAMMLAMQNMGLIQQPKIYIDAEKQKNSTKPVVARVVEDTRSA